MIYLSNYSTVCAIKFSLIEWMNWFKNRKHLNVFIYKSCIIFYSALLLGSIQANSIIQLKTFLLKTKSIRKRICMIIPLQNICCSTCMTTFLYHPTIPQYKQMTWKLIPKYIILRHGRILQNSHKGNIKNYVTYSKTTLCFKDLETNNSH